MTLWSVGTDAGRALACQAARRRASVASNVVIPLQQVSVAFPGVQTFGPFDVSAFQGARYTFNNVNASVLSVVTLQWFDDLPSAQAPSPDNRAGSRVMVLKGSEAASFTVPHMADWLVITAQPVVGGTMNMNVAMAQRQNGIQQWSVGSPETTGLLFGPCGIPQASGVTQTYTSPTGMRYAGPFHALFSASEYGGFGWDFRVNIIKSDTTASNVVRNNAVGQATILTGFIVPNPIEVVVTNNTGATGTPTITLFADDWRAA